MNTQEIYNSADPFWGNGGTQSLPLTGMGRGWNWLKAQTGNTHPGAMRPFGWISACPYSGAYSSGYGRFGCSSNGPAPELFDRKAAWGITHFHPTGTGYLGYFYNYFLFTPSLPGTNTAHISRLVNEQAKPGYYSATLSDYGVDFELTTTQCAALHRYHFRGNAGRLVINTGNVGLRQTMGQRYNEQVALQDIRRDNAGTWHGYIYSRGTCIFFDIRIQGNITEAALYNGVIELDLQGDSASAVIGCSLKSQEQASQRAEEAMKLGFDAVHKDAVSEWSAQLSRIRAEFPDAAMQARFYSTLYHSLLKPAFYEDGFIDFQTMWDTYRTQLPLALAISPQIARKVLEFQMSTIESMGFFPILFSMDDNYKHESNQACALVAYTLCDGFFRGILTKEDYPRLKAALLSEFAHAHVEDKSPTHTLDLAGALHAASCVAEACGDQSAADQFQAQSTIWKKAYDAQTGYLVENAVYYEGNHRNYSFRAHTGMAERIRLAGGTQRFLQMLDDFFTVGYIPEPNAELRPIRIGYFEAMNNESDMETPYTYLWCGRTDRLAQISDIIRRCQFTDGEGGAPGNVDSGGLSSWYVWNCLGIYPLTGTPFYLLGAPAISHAEIDFPGGTLTINVLRQSPESIYPVSYAFNGRTFREPWLPVAQLEKGGTLTFQLQDASAPEAPVPDWL